MQKFEVKAEELKGSTKEQTRKAYVVPKLAFQGRLEQITAGSGVQQSF